MVRKWKWSLLTECPWPCSRASREWTVSILVVSEAVWNADEILSIPGCR